MKNKEIAEQLRHLADELDGDTTGTADTTLTFEQVRSVAIGKSRDGKTTQVQELLKAFGVEKLSKLPEEQFAEFHAKVVAL